VYQVWFRSGISEFKFVKPRSKSNQFLAISLVWVDWVHGLIQTRGHPL